MTANNVWLPRQVDLSRENDVTATASIDRLQKKHAELDDALNREESRPHPDDAEISRMKKEKLRLKDAIADHVSDAA
jgi:uncharacterized protein YdcH (DUF465 family)